MSFPALWSCETPAETSFTSYAVNWPQFIGDLKSDNFSRAGKLYQPARGARFGQVERRTAVFPGNNTPPESNT
jgi:hypothetical protein